MGKVLDRIDERIRVFIVMEQVEERDVLTDNMRRRGPEGIKAYRRAKNAASIDGLPAFDDDPDPDLVP